MVSGFNSDCALGSVSSPELTLMQGFLQTECMAIRGWGLTHPGKSRQSNEDAFLVDETLGLFGVADGITEKGLGKQAADIALSTVQRILKENHRSFERYRKSPTVEARAKLEETLRHAVQTAGFQLYSMAQADHTKKGIATTIDVIWVVGDYAILAHVGNGRIYLMRGDEIHLLTEDHTVARQMNHAKGPYARALTRILGTTEVIAVDTLQLEISRGDRFIACSDGLSNALASHEIFHRAKGDGDFSHATDGLLRLALEREAVDNLTVVALEASPASEKPEGGVEAEEKAQIVKNVPLFRYLDYAQITKVLGIAERQHADPQTILIQEGAKGSDLFVLLRGAVEITKAGVAIASRGTGSIFGEMSVIDDSPRSASVRTTEGCELLRISREELFGLLKRDSPLAVKLFWALCQDLNLRLRATTEQVTKIKTGPTPPPGPPGPPGKGGQTSGLTSNPIQVPTHIPPAPQASIEIGPMEIDLDFEIEK